MIGKFDQATAGESQQEVGDATDGTRGVGSAPNALVSESASYLNANSSLEGELRSSQSVGIDGHFTGEIHTEEDVMIGREAEVQATVSARTVVVTGKLVGSITCATLDIQSSGRVIGNFSAQSLLSVRGAVFRGQSVMGPEEEAADVLAPPEQTRAPQASAPLPE